MVRISLMLRLQVLAMALTCTTCTAVHSQLQLQQQQQNSNKSIGVTVKVTLSDYNNPHQVLADTGHPCDVRSNCDPYFIVKLGTYRHSFQQEARSETFSNRYNISGEFYSAEFQLSQEIPDTLLIGVSVMDEDTVMDPMPYQVIAEPHAVELQQLMPSFPGGDNAFRRDIVWTPENKNVRFTLKVAAFCWPGLYGKTCGAHCDGELAYPRCDLPPRQQQQGECKSREIGCLTTGGNTAGASAGEGGSSSWLDVFTTKYMVITVIAAVAVILAIIVVVSLVLIRRRQRARALVMQDYRRQVANQHSSYQQQQQQVQQQQHLGTTLSTTLESTHTMTSTINQSFKNPLYTGGAAAARSGHPQHQPQQPQPTHEHQVDSVCTDQEVYEDIEERPGDLPPLLPPRGVV